MSSFAKTLSRQGRKLYRAAPLARLCPAHQYDPQCARRHVALPRAPARRRSFQDDEINPRHTADLHKTGATIRGHVFCSFLALVVRKALDDRLAVAGIKPEWGRLMMDLDRLQDIEIEQDGKHFIVPRW